MSIKSYLGKTFRIDSAEARVRQGTHLLKYVTYQPGEDIPSGRKVGDPRIIPQGTQVRVINAKAIDSKLTFLLAEPVAEGVVEPFGWTSADNLKGNFLNETIGQLPPRNEDKKGLNAAWDQGKYIGQRTLVEIVGSKNQTERITLDTLDAYLALTDAAAKDGITIAINSGFRTYIEQEYLYKLYKLDPKKYAMAAEPGYSNRYTQAGCVL